MHGEWSAGFIRQLLNVSMFWCRLETSKALGGDAIAKLSDLVKSEYQRECTVNKTKINSYCMHAVYQSILAHTVDRALGWSVQQPQVRATLSAFRVHLLCGDAFVDTGQSSQWSAASVAPPDATRGVSSPSPRCACRIAGAFSPQVTSLKACEHQVRVIRLMAGRLQGDLRAGSQWTAPSDSTGPCCPAPALALARPRLRLRPQELFVTPEEHRQRRKQQHAAQARGDRAAGLGL
jgi:hypothetical protein